MNKNRTLWALLPVILLCFFVQVSFGQDIREVNESLDLDRNGRVMIENHKGSIAVSTWSRSEVDIRAEIEPGGDSRREREWVDETEIRIHGSGRSVRIKTDYRSFQNRSFWGGNGGSSPYVHYTIRIPDDAHLEIEDHKSQISLSGIGGELRLNTHKGRVEIEDQIGPVNLETHKGEVRVDFSDFVDGSRFDTHKGDIEIFLPDDSQFDLDVDIGKKSNINSDFKIRRRNSRDRWRRDDDDQRFEVAVNGGGPRLQLSSHKGHFRLRRR
jgi:hypothetical protein